VLIFLQANLFREWKGRSNTTFVQTTINTFTLNGKNGKGNKSRNAGMHIFKVLGMFKAGLCNSSSMSDQFQLILRQQHVPNFESEAVLLLAELSAMQLCQKKKVQCSLTGFTALLEHETEESNTAAGPCHNHWKSGGAKPIRRN
jgi:hypothetical protein